MGESPAESPDKRAVSTIVTAKVEPPKAGRLARLPLWPFLALAMIATVVAFLARLWLPTLLESRALQVFRAERTVAVTVHPVRRSVAKTQPQKTLEGVLTAISPPLPPEVSLRFSHNTRQDAFRFLPNIRNLRNLDASGTQIRDEHLRRPPVERYFEKLNLSGTRVTDAALAQLHEIHVEVLSLADTEITDAVFDHLVTLKRLDDLDLRRTKITGRRLADLKTIPGLYALNLGGTAVGDAEVALLEGARSLSRLDLHGTRVTDDVFDTINRLANVNSLSLDRTAISDAGLARLPRSRFVWDKLSLRYTRVTSEGISQLAVEPATLNLTGSSVGDELVPWLCSRPTLWRLDLSNTRLSDKGLAALRNAHLLRTLSVRNCPITDEGVFRLLVPAQKLPADIGTPKGRVAALQALADEFRTKRVWLHRADVEGTRVTEEVKQRLDRFVTGGVEIRR